MSYLVPMVVEQTNRGERFGMERTDGTCKAERTYSDGCYQDGIFNGILPNAFVGEKRKNRKGRFG